MVAVVERLQNDWMKVSHRLPDGWSYRTTICFSTKNLTTIRCSVNFRLVSGTGRKIHDTTLIERSLWWAERFSYKFRSSKDCEQ